MTILLPPHGFHKFHHFNCALNLDFSENDYYYCGLSLRWLQDGHYSTEQFQSLDSRLWRHEVVISVEPWFCA